MAMKIRSSEHTDLEHACYDLASKLDAFANELCKLDYVNLDLIHHLVTERRRITQIPNGIKRRLGD